MVSTPRCSVTSTSSCFTPGSSARTTTSPSSCSTSSAGAHCIGCAPCRRPPTRPRPPHNSAHLRVTPLRLAHHPRLPRPRRRALLPPANPREPPEHLVEHPVHLALHVIEPATPERTQCHSYDLLLFPAPLGPSFRCAAIIPYTADCQQF